MTARRPNVVDIYCGAGGTSYGAAQAGLHVAYGLDRNRHAVETFRRNHPDAYGDVRDVAQVTGRDVLDRGDIDRVDYLLSGPNCQAVSTMGLFYDADHRNLLFTHLARLIDELTTIGARPQTVVIENVPGIAFQRNVKFIQDLVGYFLDRRYRCAADVINFATWGLPQLRYRFVLVATVCDFEPTLPAPVADVGTGRGLVTAWDAIGDLGEVEPVAAGSTASTRVAWEDLTEYQRLMRSRAKVIRNHHVGRTAPIDLERIATVPPGGSWKDIPPRLMPERFRKVRMTDYKTLYGRILEDHPAYTISASFANVTSGCYTHPRRDRALTVREGCRLQGFPDCFEVVGPILAQYRQIGNAVPALAAQKLIAHLEAARTGKRVDAVRMRLDQALLFGESEPRLPVLTPRYQRLGYGSGTYWPKGWGEAPVDRPTAATDYRISSAPFRFRRTDWRRVREEGLAEAFDDLERLDWSPTVQRLLGKDDRIAAVIDGLAPPDNGQSGDDLAKRYFLEFLGPATSLIAASVSRTGDVLARVDFGLTGEWLVQLLGAIGQRTGRPLQVIDASRPDSGVSARTPSIWVTAGPLPQRLNPARISRVFLVSPFADQLAALGLGRIDARPVEAPTDQLRIRSVRVVWHELMAALVDSANRRSTSGPRQASLFPTTTT